MPRLTLVPLGVTLQVAEGAALNDLLFSHGVEFPCGGRGGCGRCRARVLAGSLPPSVADREHLGPAEVAAGWRLLCMARMSGDLTLEVAQWESPILADDRPALAGGRGLGLAIDLGTTTLVAQLLDLASGRVLGVESALNPQGVHGADVMSRVRFAGNAPGRILLRDLIRLALGRMAGDLRVRCGGGRPIDRVVVVGNTAMHHLFCDLDPAPLARTPFQSGRLDEVQFRDADLGWDLGGAEVRFLACLGGFVGSDILAGILATGLASASGLEALIDLGTNGEIVVARGGRLLCTATAAGPAFEGAGISIGMRAATGAVNAVTRQDGRLACSVLGGGPARGICGSGLVDAVAGALDLGWVQPSGRLASGLAGIPLADGLALSGGDVRQLQLAKGAIAAGLRLLLARFGAGPGDLQRLHLAGAFGNYIDRTHAHRIGLIEVSRERVLPAGNTALLGAKLALAGGDDHVRLRRIIDHVALNEDPAFQDAYVEAMRFPDR